MTKPKPRKAISQRFPKTWILGASASHHQRIEPHKADQPSQAEEVGLDLSSDFHRIRRTPGTSRPAGDAPTGFSIDAPVAALARFPLRETTFGVVAETDYGTVTIAQAIGTWLASSEGAAYAERIAPTC